MSLEGLSFFEMDSSAEKISSLKGHIYPDAEGGFEHSKLQVDKRDPYIRQHYLNIQKKNSIVFPPTHLSSKIFSIHNTSDAQVKSMLPRLKSFGEFVIYGYDTTPILIDDEKQLVPFLQANVASLTFPRTFDQVIQLFKGFHIIETMRKTDIFDNPLSYYEIKLSSQDTKVKECANVYRILTDKHPEKKYEIGTNLYDPLPNHWGQRKLLLSEIEFITLYYQQPKRKSKMLMVYAGGAPGDHDPYLLSLFPDMHLVCYDPNPYNKHLQDLAKTPNARVKLFNQYFTDEVAQSWNPKNNKTLKDIDVIFCCDIRTVNEESVTDEKVVDENQAWQENWYYLMDPFMTMFKFRLPWQPGYTEYMSGDIYLQAYAPVRSTETRLITFGPQVPKKKYENQKYENQMFYFNCVERSITEFKVPLSDKTLERIGMNRHYDNACELYIIMMYFESFLGKTPTEEEIAQMSIDISHKISSHRTLKSGMPLKPVEVKILVFLQEQGKLDKSIGIRDMTRTMFNTEVRKPDNAKLIEENFEKIRLGYRHIMRFFSHVKESYNRSAIFKISS
jgi:hypothetical protein